MESELQIFMKDMSVDVEKADGDFRFDLLRWSKEEPYWCLFACEHGNANVFSGIDGVLGIGGHYCIGKEENLHVVLSILVDFGCKLEIHQDYFHCSL